MIHSVRFTCLLDANVIYPLWIRDLLLWFAHHDLYTPKWCKHIFDEWFEAMIRKGVSKDEAIKRTSIVNDAFPDALVENYEPLIETLTLPGRLHVSNDKGRIRDLEITDCDFQ